MSPGRGSPSVQPAAALARAHTRVRRAAALLLAACVVTLMATPAVAAAYRFWGYFQWDGTAWVFAQTGPTEAVPADGAVEGWRFAVGDESATKVPRAEGSFELICGDTPPVDGQKRVAVVIDYGTPADAAASAGEPPAPSGRCAVVDEQATGSQVLSAVAEQRVEDSLVCGIDGWPASGCGEAVEGPAPADPTDTVALAVPGADSPGETADTADAAADSGFTSADLPWLIAAGAMTVLLVGVWAWVRLRPHGEDEPAS